MFLAGKRVLSRCWRGKARLVRALSNIAVAFHKGLIYPQRRFVGIDEESAILGEGRVNGNKDWNLFPNRY